MKHSYILIIIFLLCSCIQEQLTSFSESNSTNPRTVSSDSYYWYHGEKIPLYEASNKVFAIFDKTSTEELYDPVTRSTSTRSLSAEPYHSSNRIFETDGHPENIIWTKVDKDLVIANPNIILYSAPYFLTETGDEIGVTNYFMIQLKSSKDYNILEQFALDNNVTIVDRNERSLWNTLACGSRTTENALQLANKAYESGLFSATDIVFENDFKASADNPDYNDLYYSQQWNLTDTYGINLNSTHSITTGHPNIKVAVIDNGFQLDHPDMLMVSSNSWDATSQSSPAKQYLYNGKTYNNHGTGVASIIGANINNDIGIAGIAPNVTLLPISVDFSISTTDTTSHNPLTSLSNAIEHAVSSGADVINNSWSNKMKHDALSTALDTALTNGRNGNGCIVVFASGNDSSNITLFPAVLHDDVIIVGGSDALGKRRESSNYSDKLDLIAPGGDIPILADKGTEDYDSGTSFAAPHVSAIAGLILSVNPALTRQQVSEIIDKTARKLPEYTFSETEGRPNGTWNEEVGYGLINAMDAVSLAKGYYNLISFDYTGSTVEFSVTANKDIAIIWDWETEDITEVPLTSSTTRTFTHTYGTNKKRRIYIAEKIDLETDPIPVNSTALTEFVLTSGEDASDVEVKPRNIDLEYIRIVGGADIASQTVSIKDLPSLKDLYLVHMPDIAVEIRNCPELLRFGSSNYIWGSPSDITINPDLPMLPVEGEILGPDNVNGGAAGSVWPDVPEPVQSFCSLSIEDCENLTDMSLENVGITSFDFSGLPSLRYLYVSSQDDMIVGGTDSSYQSLDRGRYLAGSIFTLPDRSGQSTKGRIRVRGVSQNNTGYVTAIISLQNRNWINTFCSDNNWNVIWDSGVTDSAL